MGPREPRQRTSNSALAEPLRYHGLFLVPETGRRAGDSILAALVSKHIVMHTRGPIELVIRLYRSEATKSATWRARLVSVIIITMGDQDTNDAGRCCVSIHEGIGSKVRNR